MAGVFRGQSSGLTRSLVLQAGWNAIPTVLSIVPQTVPFMMVTRPGQDWEEHHSPFQSTGWYACLEFMVTHRLKGLFLRKGKGSRFWPGWQWEPFC